MSQQIEILENRFENAQLDWQKLESSLKPSFFQSISWQRLWTSKLRQSGIEPLFLSLALNNRIVLMSSLVIGSSKVLKILPRKSVYFNASGQSELDVVCAEECQPMMREDLDPKLFSEFLSYLLEQKKVEEFYLSTVPLRFEPLIRSSANQLNLDFKEERRSAHFWIDLEKIRQSGKPYLSALNQRTRGIIKRGIQGFEKIHGAVILEHAENEKQAISWLEKLIELNIKALASKGVKSSFHYPFLKKFHFELIEDCFSRGEIHMSRVSSGAQEIGFIYGFNYNKGLYVYQTGFNFDLDKKLSPGLVSHNIITEDALSKGFVRYDFLAGDYQYKKSLSNVEEQHVWIRLSKKSWALDLEKQLRKIKVALLSKK